MCADLKFDDAYNRLYVGSESRLKLNVGPRYSKCNDFEIFDKNTKTLTFEGSTIGVPIVNHGTIVFE